MKKKVKLIIFLLMICLITTNVFCVATKNNLSATGYWLQYSDKMSERAQSVMHIYHEKNGTLSGKIATPLFKAEKKHATIPDVSCAATCGKGDDNGYKYDYTSMPGSQVQGLKILWGLTKGQPEEKRHSATYYDGSILDPVSGKVYSCKAILKQNGNILKATGYIFIPWFGRTQTWRRISDTKAKSLIGKCGLTSKGFYPYADASGDVNNKELWEFCSNVNP